MSAFERPKGSGRWVAKYQLHGDQVWVDGGPWPSKSAAREAEDRDRQRRLARRTNETCASFADRWVKEWPRPSAETRKTYERAAKRFAAQFGSTPLGEVERLSARTWSLSVPRGVSKAISTMYQDAYDVGLVTANPFANLRLPSNDRVQKVFPPTPEQFRNLLAGCTVLGGYGPEFRAMIQFAAWEGMRIGEIAGLQWPDVEADFIRVRRSRKNDGSLGLPKNGFERKIPYMHAARVLDQVPRREGSPFVFHSPRGMPLNKGNHNYSWRLVRAASGVAQQREAAGLPNVRFHDLRHLCATQLLERGMDHFAVSILLGHKDGGTLVTERYGHPSEDAARERLLALDGAGERATGSSAGSRKVAG